MKCRYCGKPIYYRYEFRAWVHENGKIYGTKLVKIQGEVTEVIDHRATPGEDRASVGGSYWSKTMAGKK